MQDSIYLYSRGDRLGSHLIQYLSIIIYAFYNNLYIVYDPSKINYNSDYVYENAEYKKSFFVQSLLVWIDNYNAKFPIKDYHSKYKNIQPMEYLLEFEIEYNQNAYFYSCDLLIITTQVLYTIRSDLISYFTKYIKKSLLPCIETNIPKDFTLPFNPNRSILVHLRMGDVKDRSDYDGRICSDYYSERINSDNKIIQGIRNLGYCNRQTPLDQRKIINAINQATFMYPEHEVIIITQPGDYGIPYNYRCIRSNDENYDLYLLCNADVLILSRSTFSLTSAFLGSAKDVWCPSWGHFVTTGLNTKYDKTSQITRFHYFY